jgi:hypothetical protein
MTRIGEGCHNLEDLNLSGCSEVTDLGLKSLDKLGETLKCINFSGCIKVTDEGMRMMFQLGQEEDAVDLGETGGFGDTGTLFDDMEDGLPAATRKLEKIILCNCVEINNDGIEAMAKASPNLKVLNLFGVSHVNDRGIKAIAKSCKELTMLVLSGVLRVSNGSRKSRVPRVTDTGLRMLADNCEKLECLHIDLARVSDKGMGYLARAKCKFSTCCVSTCCCVRVL